MLPLYKQYGNCSELLGSARRGCRKYGDWHVVVRTAVWEKMDGTHGALQGVDGQHAVVACSGDGWRVCHVTAHGVRACAFHRPCDKRWFQWVHGGVLGVARICHDNSNTLVPMGGKAIYTLYIERSLHTSHVPCDGRSANLVGVAKAWYN